MTTDELEMPLIVTKSDTGTRVTEKVSSGSVTSLSVIVMVTHCVDMTSNVSSVVSQLQDRERHVC